MDYENYFGGDGKIDFTVMSNPNLHIQVKTRQIPIKVTSNPEDLGRGEVRDVKAEEVAWFASSEEIRKNAVIACVGIVGDVNETQKEYYLINAGFIPCNMIEVSQEKTKLRISDLLYGFGLKHYLESLL